jgi:hypothetical protein
MNEKEFMYNVNKFKNILFAMMCHKCKYWGHTSEDLNWGVCDNEKVSENTVLFKTDDVKLTTNRYFACKFFELE